MAENKELDLDLDIEIPTLEAELASMDDLVVVPEEEKTEVANGSFLKEEDLTPAEAKAVADLAEKIDISNSKVVLYYGTACQKEIASFSDAALNNIRTKDLGEVGDMITSLVGELKGFNAETEDQKGFLGLFKKPANTLAKLQAKYAAAET
ncbi:MAG: toxic anion resistance protein, partial [Oscillospiraceae bacterium]|nr:toxic anion resistance protein [Oscillospiraceae bacterium]